jgi:hypothetical protein
MEAMFRAVFEKLIHWIALLTMLGVISWWTVDLQKKAYSAKATGLISLTKINHALFAGERARRL